MKITDNEDLTVKLVDSTGESIILKNEIEINFVNMISPIIANTYGLAFYQHVLEFLQKRNFRYYAVANEINRSINIKGYIDCNVLRKNLLLQLNTNKLTA